MAALIYSLCALTAFLCAWLLLQAYGKSQYKLLLWGGVCFVGLTFSNGLLVVDKVLTGPEVDLAVMRYGTTLLSIMVLLYGLIMDSD